ncbi:MAG: glutathione S-transferase family protein [Alphaproteobacteria bacterium]|jgi:glutathione S-transferase
MKLYQSPTSPYVRMVHIVALELGLADTLEHIPARTKEANLPAINPLDKIPTLVTDDGLVMIESKLICQYLDDLKGTNRLYPKDITARHRVLQQEAAVHGMLDAAVLRRMETRREDSERSAWWDERQINKIIRTRNMLEKNIEAFTKYDNIVPIALGAALEFMDRIQPDDPWQNDHPKLAAWLKDFSENPNMVKTRMPD